MPAIWQNNTTIRHRWVRKSRSFLWMMPARTRLDGTVQLTAAWSVSGQALGRARCDSANKWLERFYYPNPACSETRSEPPQEESLGTTPSPCLSVSPSSFQGWWPRPEPPPTTMTLHWMGDWPPVQHVDSPL